MIDELDTLQALTEPTRVAMLEVLAEPSSVRQVAAALGVPRTRLYHHVELLVAAGLIEQVDERRAGALSERVYAVSAKRFQVDPKLLEILVCPLTKTTLEYDAERQELISRAAKLAYPIRDGIPIMLPDEARQLED